MRNERGPIFQGRYKSLLVADGRLGPLCHYIYLNPVRAKMRTVADLKQWPWTSLFWMTKPRERQSWYTPDAALDHAGDLADTPAGHRRYLKYLDWITADDLAQREMLFANMCRGWVIGTVDDKNKVIARQLEHRTFAPETGLRSTQEAIWQTWVDKLLRRLKRTSQGLIDTPKSADWKRAIALVMKAKTTATNRWLGKPCTWAVCMK
jgi:putative transposase